MHINEAITYLQNAKKSGTKNIMIAWWEANSFGLKDNKDWEEICNQSDEDMELSNIYEEIQNFVEFASKKESLESLIKVD